MSVPPPAEAGDHSEKASRRRLLRLTGLILVAVALLVGIYGLVAYLGWQSGLEQREQQAAEALATEIARQVELARSDVAGGNYNLALTRLEWVLEREPGRRDALALRTEAETRLGARLTPEPTATAEPAATTPTPGPTPDIDQRLVALERLLEEEAWEQAIEAIIRFQRQQPDYRRRDTDEMLYDAYLGAARGHLDSATVEAGLYYLSLAQELRDLPQEMLDRRGWAELYLTGMAFYGVDWQATILNFRDLCLAAPFYQDSCGKLYRALVAYGDQFAAVQEWCPAESYYREAFSYDSDAQLREKVGTATEGCLAATPTPSPTPDVITDTVPIEDGTPPPTLEP